VRLSEPIYYAISGEGVHAGTPSNIIRLQGCNLACTYCDSKYSRDPKEGIDISVATILERPSWPRWVLITGGEPLLQAGELSTLISSLIRYGVSTEIETNGSIVPPTWWKSVNSWSADIKCPSSGMRGKSVFEWFGTRECDQIKFVVKDREDLDFAREIIASHRGCLPVILVSPAYPWSQEWLQTCAAFCKAWGVRLSLQLHKIIFGDVRGV